MIEDDDEINEEAKRLRHERYDGFVTFGGPTWREQLDGFKDIVKNKYGWAGIIYLQREYSL